jgi:hypothetical protein
LGAHLANSPCVAFGHPSCVLVALLCVRAPTLPTCVALHLGQTLEILQARLVLCWGRIKKSTHLTNSALVPFWCPSCKLASHRVWVPYLVFTMTPLVGAHLSKSPCLWGPKLSTHLAFVHPPCQLALPCLVETPNFFCT